MRPALEVADVFRRHGEAFRHGRAAHLGRVERRVMSAIEQWPQPLHSADTPSSAAIAVWSAKPTTPAVTGIVRSARVWRAPSGSRRAKPNCCLCLTITWSSPCRRSSREIAFQNKRVVYAILFPRPRRRRCTTSPPDPCHLGAEVGAVAVLHTWGQTLQHHPHLHCIVPGGGLSPDQNPLGAVPARILSCRSGCLSHRFRTLFLAQLRARRSRRRELRFSGALAALEASEAFAERVGVLRGIDWVVYSKRPFAGPDQVLAYLGRYTHRVAIANSRLTALQDGQVSFTWKDYRQEAKGKGMMS